MRRKDSDMTTAQEEEPEKLSLEKQEKSDQEEIKQPRRPGRKRIETGMVQRKDVVLKKVLRRMRAFFWKKFNTLTKFSTRKR